MKTITVKDLLNGQPNVLTKDKIKQALEGANGYLTSSSTITELNAFLKAHNLSYVSPSDVLQAIYINLNDEAVESIQDFNIYQVSDLEEFIIDSLKELQATDSLAYGFSVSALYALLDYKGSDFVEYDNNLVSELDFDTLTDALDVDQKRRNQNEII